MGFSENIWNTNVKLFDIVNLSPLSTNVNHPTEMMITFNYSAVSIGPSQGKLLLL